MNKKITSISQENNETIGRTARNLAYLMSQQGIDSSALSKATGLGMATINMLRRGEGNPTLSTMLILAGYFKVSLSELTEMNLTLEGVKPNVSRRIPFVPMNEISQFMDNRLAQRDTYTTEIDDPDWQTYFAVVVNNDSLYPQFSSGTVFIVASEQEACDGDIVLVKLGNYQPCFRKIFVAGERYLFSPVAVEGELSPAACENYQLMGVVVKAIKRFC